MSGKWALINPQDDQIMKIKVTAIENSNFFCFAFEKIGSGGGIISGIFAKLHNKYLAAYLLINIDTLLYPTS